MMHCKSKEETPINIQVIGTVYNSIPKNIPPPPKKLIDTSKINYKDLKPSINNYAINDVYLKNGLIKPYLKNNYLPYDEKLTNDTINKISLNKFLGENQLYLSKDFVSKEEKKELDIVGIVSFTNVFFNEEYNEAFLGAVIYSSSLDAAFIVYTLVNENNIWKIKKSRVISFS